MRMMILLLVLLPLQYGRVIIMLFFLSLPASLGRSFAVCYLCWVRVYVVCLSVVSDALQFVMWLCEPDMLITSRHFYKLGGA